MRRYLLGLLLLVGCTDAEYAQLSAIGDPANIVCYSGNKMIYKGRSTGKLHTEQGSDGWFFQEEGSRYLMRVSGACVVTQKTGSSPALPALPEDGKP